MLGRGSTRELYTFPQYFLFSLRKNLAKMPRLASDLEFSCLRVWVVKIKMYTTMYGSNSLITFEDFSSLLFDSNSDMHPRVFQALSVATP